MKKISLEMIQQKIITYQIVVMLSFVFGVIGFIYNNWRYEHNEYNNNVRIASFQMIQELAKLEQNIYANHYDHNTYKGSPRDGWVRVGLVESLAAFISPETHRDSLALKKSWEKHWRSIHDDEKSTNILIEKIDQVRSTTKEILLKLH